MNEILISGYYGFKNSGDDALLQSITGYLKKNHPNFKIVVLSKNPEETKKLYGVDAISRTNVFLILWHTLKAKLLISGGGTLIQDATSTKSLIYYLTIISIANFFKVPVMLYGNGIGPLNSEKNKRRAKKVLNKIACITLRDEKSAEVLASLGVSNPKIEVTADPVFMTETIGPEKGLEILRAENVPTDKKILGINLRDCKNPDPHILEKLTFSINEICEKTDLFPVFLPLQPQDTEICEKIAGRISQKSVIIQNQLSVTDMLSVISNFHIAIGMRLHMLIYASIEATPLVGISYDPKIHGFLDYIGMDKFVLASELDENALILHTKEILNNYDNTKKALIETSKKMKALAEKNPQSASAILEEV